MSSPAVYSSDAVDGLADSLPGRNYKQDEQFWVFVALQDWLRSEGNANLLGYDSSNSVRVFQYPTRAGGQRLTPREVFYLFKKPPASVAAQLPRCYCAVLQDDNPVLVKSFVSRKDDSPHFGKYGLTCANRRNRCGYFTWLQDAFDSPELDVAPASAPMLDHVHDAQRRDAERAETVSGKKRNFRSATSKRVADGYSSAEADFTSSEAYSSEPDESARVSTSAQPLQTTIQSSSGLLGVHGRPSKQTSNHRAAKAHSAVTEGNEQGPATKRPRWREPARGACTDHAATASTAPPSASPQPPPAPLLPAAATEENGTPPSVYAERPGSTFIWSITADGADETEWDRAARRLEVCCGRVWEQFAIARHRCSNTNDVEAYGFADHGLDAARVIPQLFDPPGVLLDDWFTVAASMRRCCGRVWVPHIFNRVHNPCPNNAILFDD